MSADPVTRAVEGERRSPDVKSRLHATALRLFSEHGISDTTLQMIADELGVTKAAVYYYYKSKDELVLGVVRPFQERLRQVVELAEAQRGRRTRAEVALTGLADLIVSARQVHAVLTVDPSIRQVVQRSPGFLGIRDRLFELLAGPRPSPELRVRVTLLMSGMVGPLLDPVCGQLDDETLRTLLTDTGRRLLFHRS